MRGKRVVSRGRELPRRRPLDPTRTTTLRKRFSTDMRKRFNAIRSAILEVIWKRDALGLIESQPLSFNAVVSNALPERQAWRFQTNDQKLTSFNTWLQGQVDQEILIVEGASAQPWTSKYISSAYKQGSLRAYMDTHSEDMAVNPSFYQGSRAQFLESAFNQPERLSKIKFLSTRTYEELKGVTSSMGQQMNRILANGLVQGQSPRVIARDMSKQIQSITRTRALVIARTEVIAAHAEGQLDSFEDLGVEEVGVLAEWSTAGDDRVCPMCEPLDGTVMTVDEARGLIPRHPNCRCAWIPANVGEEPKNKRFKTAKEKQSRIDKSLKAELPKKTRAGKKVPQTVKEAKRRSSWLGKTKDFN